MTRAELAPCYEQMMSKRGHKQTQLMTSASTGAVAILSDPYVRVTHVTKRERERGRRRRRVGPNQVPLRMRIVHVVTVHDQKPNVHYKGTVSVSLGSYYERTCGHRQMMAPYQRMLSVTVVSIALIIPSWHRTNHLLAAPCYHRRHLLFRRAAIKRRLIGCICHRQ